ncbi:hypothetical protein ACLOJK_024834 [Asimina triloba]
MGTRYLSSQIGAKDSSIEDALEGFSGLDTPSDIDETRADLVSEPEVSDGESEDSELGFSRSKAGMNDDKDSDKIAANKLLMCIARTRLDSVYTALDEWTNKGNMVDREEVMMALQNLRKRCNFGKALKLIEWVEANNHLDLTEDDYSSHADLIAKVHGFRRAEKYIESRIPVSLRGGVVYQTLLANCVIRNDCENAERVFDKMRVLGFPLTTSTYNQLLMLYKLSNCWKFEEVLLMMEKENVKPDLLTYRLLIDIKGFANKIEGMELVLESMKADGVEPDSRILASAANHYHRFGHHDKVKAILNEIEGRKLTVNYSVYTYLFRLYSIFGNTDEVGRLWNECEASPRLQEYLAALAAWGRLRNVEKAEAVFEKIVEKWKNATVKHYLMLLNIYAERKMLAKGKDLMRRMMDDGIRFGPFTWNTVARLFAECGEVEKADTLLQKLPQLKTDKRMYKSYIAMLDKYAQKGDVRNAERIFDSLRQCAYFGPIRQYNLLLRAYMKAKKPAYGFRERLKADGISPKQGLASKLVKLETSMWKSEAIFLD